MSEITPHRYDPGMTATPTSRCLFCGQRQHAIVHAVPLAATSTGGNPARGALEAVLVYAETTGASRQKIIEFIKGLKGRL